MKTTIPKEADIRRSWYLVNASDKVLGRMAVKIANVVRGKNKPIFTPHVDTGDYVIVINANQVKLTGKKETQKIYLDYSGYRGGLKQTKASDVRTRNPERMIYDAVRRMLPKNRLMRSAIKRLKVYAGEEHPHEAQNPQALDL
ncbi:MAG: 50S ribosomal protein L13 [Planctomycetes bacterium]|nr:50S ribosomal protein L13 [Planctomycetota bacterium]